MSMIPKQLAEHIDKECRSNISQFFNEDGSLRQHQPGEGVFMFMIACALVVYEPDEHSGYKDFVHDMLQGDIDGLKHVQDAIGTFAMPEPEDNNIPCAVCGSTKELHTNMQCGDCGYSRYI